MEKINQNLLNLNYDELKSLLIKEQLVTTLVYTPTCGTCHVAKKMLEDPRLNIKDIGSASGYTDSNYFARVFKRMAGCTPTEYRANMLVNRKVL